MRHKHRDLVKRAGRWLTGSRDCVLVMLEAQAWAVNEFPDAIGWTIDGYSVLIECKTSRSDFLRDRHKISKRDGVETMGRERWYMTPPGLLKAADLSEGCGLLEVHGRSVRRVHEASVEPRPGCADAEVKLLVIAARREAWNREHDSRRVTVVCDHRAEGQQNDN